MGVTIRKKGGKWYVFVNHHGRRKAKCVGASRQVAEEVRRQLEARLALGDLGFLADTDDHSPTFGDYARRWVKEYAEVHCKTSTVVKHNQVLHLHVLPVFESKRLDEITRDDLKRFLADAIAKPKRMRKKAAADAGAEQLEPTCTLSRNSVRLILSTVRVILAHAMEDGLIQANPAAALGRFAKVAKEQFLPSPLSPDEARRFLEAAREVVPAYYPLFLMALRAGLRRGELVALKWGDIQFGESAEDPNRYLLVQRNYVYGEFTTPKSKKARRVDLSKQLRAALLELRDERLVQAFAAGRASIMDELVFPSPEGSVLDPDNLYDRYFLPVLERAGLRRIRFHDLRHTFGSLLIQSGASPAYVKEQMGHSSIQVTVDIYGHLMPGANVACVDRLDADTSPQQSATQAQPAHLERSQREDETARELAELERVGGGGGGWTRTSDLGIMRPSL